LKGGGGECRDHVRGGGTDVPEGEGVNPIPSSMKKKRCSRKMEHSIVTKAGGEGKSRSQRKGRERLKGKEKS